MRVYLEIILAVLAFGFATYRGARLLRMLDALTFTDQLIVIVPAGIFVFVILNLLPLNLPFWGQLLLSLGGGMYITAGLIARQNHFDKMLRNIRRKN